MYDESKTQTTIKTIKGFERGLVCRGYKFEQGKTYAVEGGLSSLRIEADRYGVSRQAILAMLNRHRDLLLPKARAEPRK